MNNNIHPLLVHFPLAFLGLYAILEIARFRILTRQQWYVPAKMLLVFVGALATYPTVAAGAFIAGKLKGHGLDHVINTHATFALTTVVIFNLIALAYVVSAINRTQRETGPAFLQSSFWRVLTHIQKLITDTSVVLVLALLGLGTLTITGALGGTIVYGPDFEPLASIIYHLFFH